MTARRNELTAIVVNVQVATTFIPKTPPSRLPQGCLMSLFYGAIAIVINLDSTLGSRIAASASLVGCAPPGLLMTGAAVRSPPLPLSKCRPFADNFFASSVCLLGCAPPGLLMSGAAVWAEDLHVLPISPACGCCSSRSCIGQ